MCNGRDTGTNVRDRTGERCREREREREAGTDVREKETYRRGLTRNKTQPCIIISYSKSSSISDKVSGITAKSKINKRCGHHSASHIIQYFDV
jgi:hypothetical protein